MSTTTFQQRVEPWLLACFGEQIAADTIERNHRFIEEALELVQACSCTQSEAHQLVDYVFGRPVGEVQQEAGGVMVTLAALCRAQGISMHEAGEKELARIWTKVEAIRAKQAAKPKHSPLPGPAAALAQQAVPPDARDGINGPFNACMYREHCRSMLAAAPEAPECTRSHPHEDMGAACQRKTEEARAASAARQAVPEGHIAVPVRVLKDASNALGNFVSDHGWSEADMQAMDNLDAYLAPPSVQSMLAAAPAAPQASQGAAVGAEPDWLAMLYAPRDGSKIELLVEHREYWIALKDGRADGYRQACEGHWVDFNGGGWSWMGTAGQPIGWRPLRAGPAFDVPVQPMGGSDV